MGSTRKDTGTRARAMHHVILVIDIKIALQIGIEQLEMNVDTVEEYNRTA